MKYLFYKITAVLSCLPALILPTVALAQVTSAKKELQDIATAANIPSRQSNLPTLIGNIINALISVLGIVFVALIVYAGFLYLTAQGEDENVKKAKKLLTQAVIGLVIIISAYAVSIFVFQALEGAVTTTGTAQG